MSPSLPSPTAGDPGVSVVICCHNSTARLPETPAHLQRQETEVPWEFLLIDNASTDATASLAKELWPPNAPAPLRVIAEPRLGLSLARKRGFVESRFGLVSFVDDDNWLASDWVSTARHVMTEHPEVGACGGHSDG